MVEGLRARVWGSSWTYQVLEGLGWAASSPALDNEPRGEVVESFLTLLDGKMPGAQGHLRRRQEEEVFYLGPETTVYTEMIPALLGGLERIHAGAGTPDAFRRRIVDQLLRKWDEVTTFRVIWSPRLPITLGELLGRFARHPSSDSARRMAIVEALRTRETNFQVLAALGELADIAPRSTPLSRHLGEVAEIALRLIASQDMQVEEDQQHLLGVLQRLLHRPTLGPDRSASDGLKRRMLYVMFEAARGGLPGSVRLLEQLRDAGVLPRAMQRDLEQRLPEWA